MFIISILYLAIIVLMIMGYWKIFEKLGEPGWKCLIPIYNIIVLMEKINWDVWKIVLFFIPIAQIIFAFLFWRDLGAKFGKGTGFAIGLMFLPFIFIPLLGFKGEVVAEEVVAA